MIARNVESAAALNLSTDGATGQPLRAADVELQSSKLSAIREAEALAFSVSGPDETLCKCGHPRWEHTGDEHCRECHFLDGDCLHAFSEAPPVDQSPCEEGIAAVEDRAHTAAWHQYLSLPDDN